MALRSDDMFNFTILRICVSTNVKCSKALKRILRSTYASQLVDRVKDENSGFDEVEWEGKVHNTLYEVLVQA